MPKWKDVSTFNSINFITSLKYLVWGSEWSNLLSLTMNIVGNRANSMCVRDIQLHILINIYPQYEVHNLVINKKSLSIWWLVTSHNFLVCVLDTALC